MAGPHESALSAPAAPLAGGRKVAVLLLPWLFLAVFVFMANTFFLPHITRNVLTVCLGLFLGMVFVSFLAAAVTFSRDVLRGRYP